VSIALAIGEIIPVAVLRVRVAGFVGSQRILSAGRLAK
jgi:hypothetical protein